MNTPAFLQLINLEYSAEMILWRLDWRIPVMSVQNTATFKILGQLNSGIS